jgi:hypothetical protein
MVSLPPNPNRDFLTEKNDKLDRDIDRLMSQPPLSWEEIFDDVVRARVGKLIANAARESNKQGPH